MIQKTQGYTANGKLFTELRDAQIEEINVLLTPHLAGKSSLIQEEYPIIATAILNMGAHLVDILTTKPSSRTVARKVNGATRKRTPKVVPPTAPAA